MKASHITLWVLALGLLTSCEKFELNEHCPKDEPSIDAQQARAMVNDDSDQEETFDHGVENSLDASGDLLIQQSSTSEGGDSDNTDGDLVNDDSDDEEEVTSAKQPTGLNGGGGNGPKSGRP